MCYDKPCTPVVNCFLLFYTNEAYGQSLSGDNAISEAYDGSYADNPSPKQLPFRSFGERLCLKIEKLC